MQNFTRLTILIAAATLMTVYAGAVGLILSRSIGYRIVSVASGSMSPVINRGDALIVKQTDVQGLQIGQLLSYKMNDAKGEIITHRIVAVGANGIQTKGDANKMPDHPIARSQIYASPVARLIHFGTVLDLLKRPIGIFFGIYVPSILIIGYEVWLVLVRATSTHYLLDYSYAKKRQKA